MLSRFLPAPVRGALSSLLYFLNTVFWCSLILPFALLKLVLPEAAFHRGFGRLLTAIGESWIGVNNLNQRLFSRIRWDVQGAESLPRRSWYMVVANHQSSVDILVLQKIFNRRIPFFKFFLKKELIWFPFLGIAWWTLGFPFMQRYSRGHLKRNPHLKGRDLEITRRACERFKSAPVSVMNFVEGTRFTPEKHRRQRSPYQHLLRAKAGGMAFVLGAMGEQMHRILDVTIVYPEGPPTFWQYACGRVKEIQVRVRALPVGEELLGDYLNDRRFHRDFQTWLNRLWEEKDAAMETLLENRPGSPALQN